VTVKELLGHSPVTVTMRYAYTNFDAKARAVEQLDRTPSSDKPVTVALKRRRIG